VERESRPVKGLVDGYFWMTPRGYELVCKNELTCPYRGRFRSISSNIAVMAKETKVGETACLRRYPEMGGPDRHVIRMQSPLLHLRREVILPRREAVVRRFLPDRRKDGF